MLKPYYLGITIDSKVYFSDPYGLLGPPPPRMKSLTGRALCLLLGHDPWYPVIATQSFDIVHWSKGVCTRCGKALGERAETIKTTSEVPPFGMFEGVSNEVTAGLFGAVPSRVYPDKGDSA